MTILHKNIFFAAVMKTRSKCLELNNLRLIKIEKKDNLEFFEWFTINS